MTTRIVLADDHKIVRQGLRFLLESESDLQVIAEAATGTEAAAIIQKEQPEVLVADIRMPGLTGIELVREIKKTSPKTVTVILSMFSDEAYIIEALRAGARGYVAKESSVEELVAAIRKAISGQVFVSGSAASKKVKALLKGKVKA